MARAPASLAGLIEIRGLGIMRFPYVAEARPVLVAQLGHEIARLPSPRRDPLLALPAINIDPRPAAAAQVVALAFETVTGRAVQHAGAFV